MSTFQGVDELRQAVGEHLGYSEWLDVDQAMVDKFADTTGDHQWIHVDQNRAAEGPFGTTIAHGFLTLALLPVLSWQVFSVKGLAMEINYGSDKVRFPSAVPVPSRVRAGIELLSVEPFADGYLAKTKVVMEREGGEKPVCVVESLGYMVPT